MQFFTVAILGAVASAMATVKETDITYSSLTSTDSCMKVTDCATLDKKAAVTHEEFRKCLAAASNKCEFTAKVNNIFTDSHEFGDTAETALFGTCTNGEADDIKRVGINMSNVLKVAELAHGEDVTLGGSIKVKMNEKPTKDTDIKVMSQAYTNDCPSEVQFNAFEKVTFTGAVDTSTATPHPYILTIKAEDALKDTGLFFRSESNKEFLSSDFSGVTFDIKVKGAQSTEGAFGLFASSALVSLGLTYFAF